MPVGLMQIQRPRSAMQDIADGLNVAESALGIAVNWKRFQEMGDKDAKTRDYEDAQGNLREGKLEGGRLVAKADDPIIKPPKQSGLKLPELKDYEDEQGNKRWGKVTAEGLVTSPGDPYKERKKPDKAGGEGAAGIKLPGDPKTAIPGFVHSGDIQPSVTEVKSARDALAAFQTLDTNLQELRQLIGKKGSFQVTGPEGARMNALATASRLSMKEMANLGVLSATDYQFLDKMIQDPSSMGALLTRDNTAIAQVDAMLETSQRRVGDKLRTLGYQPTEQTTVGLFSKPQPVRRGDGGTAYAAPGGGVSRDEALMELKRRGVNIPQR